MSEEDTIARLKTLGLNLYESRAYVALLSGKQLTAKGVGQLALIPQSRTYDVLESLTRKGFAQATPASPPSYVAVPPDKVLGSYYDSERKKIRDQASRVHEEAQAKLDVLRDAYVALTSEFPAKADAWAAERDRVWVLQKRENIENTLVDLIKEAKSEVLRITKPPGAGGVESLDPFYIVGLENRRFVFEALEKGVDMKWLSLAREIPTYLGLNVGEPPERRYLESDEDITEKFLLVDNGAVLLNLHDPLSPSYGYVALAMRSKAVSSIFRDRFEKMWEKGRPLDEVLPKMKESVEDLCGSLTERGLGRVEVAVYRNLARLGAVTQDVLEQEMGRKKVPQQETQTVLPRMIRLGLVRKDPAHRLLMVEHPWDVRSSIEKGRIRLDGGRVTTQKKSSGKNS